MEKKNEQHMKIIKGEYGYVLEDVPHLSDYIPNLPVCFSFPLFCLFLRL